MRTDAEVTAMIEASLHKPKVYNAITATTSEGPWWRARCVYCGWCGPLRPREEWAQYDADGHKP